MLVLIVFIMLVGMLRELCTCGIHYCPYAGKLGMRDLGRTDVRSVFSPINVLGIILIPFDATTGLTDALIFFFLTPESPTPIMTC